MIRATTHIAFSCSRAHAHRWWPLLWFIVAWALPAISWAQDPPPRYFPLDAGRTWSLTPGEPHVERFEIQVLAREGDVALVRYLPLVFLGSRGTVYRGGAYDLILRERGLEIDLFRDGEWLPFYRFGEEMSLHYDCGFCEDRRTLGVTLLTEPTETPAGTFTDCLFVGYGRSLCADGGRIYEIFCPDVGPVIIFNQGFAGGIELKLLALEPSPKDFVRGDANADGSVNLSDAFAILNALFIWGEFYHVPCDDAADVNDDGALNISDAIFLLGSLFGAGRAIPPPAECAPDPTEEDLHCGSYFPCCADLDCPGWLSQVCPSF